MAACAKRVKQGDLASIVLTGLTDNESNEVLDVILGVS